METTIYADLEDLGLTEHQDDELSTAIEDRAAALLALGVSLAGIAEAAVDMLVAAGFSPGWRMVVIPADEDGREVVLAVVLDSASAPV